MSKLLLHTTERGSREGRRGVMRERQRVEKKYKKSSNTEKKMEAPLRFRRQQRAEGVAIQFGR